MNIENESKNNNFFYKQKSQTFYNIYGIIGYPLSHSLSPLLHTTSFNDHNISSLLAPWAIESENLEKFINSFKLLNIQGCCVTIPHKKAIIQYLDHITERAQKVGAVNLIYRKNNQIWGDNTDVAGFIKPLKDYSNIDKNCDVLLLGSGGAARAVIVGLQILGFKNITITGTNEKLNVMLQNEFGLNKLQWHERNKIDAKLIINATPAGMKGKFENESPYDKEWFGEKGIAYDIVYTPENTKFLQYAQESGWQTISGLSMFLEQANEQFKTWTNKDLSKNSINQVKTYLQTNN